MRPGRAEALRDRGNQFTGIHGNDSDVLIPTHRDGLRKTNQSLAVKLVRIHLDGSMNIDKSCGSV